MFTECKIGDQFCHYIITTILMPHFKDIKFSKFTNDVRIHCNNTWYIYVCKIENVNNNLIFLLMIKVIR